MDVRNCRRCGKVYVYDNFNICPKCRRDDELDFQKVKEYIEENPDANVGQVAEETEVDSRKIIDFLKQGRLEIKDEDNLILSCERCGKPIKTGRFCDRCTFEMQREFKQSIGKSRNSKANPKPNQSGSTKATERIRVTERYNLDENK